MTPKAEDKKQPQAKKSAQPKTVVIKKSVTSKRMAVIRLGGKQYLVKNGDEILVEKIAKKDNEKFNIADVLAIFEDSENILELGAPLAKAVVEAQILEQVKSPKIYIVKYKPKIRYRRRTGHRQLLTKIKIIKV